MLLFSTLFNVSLILFLFRPSALAPVVSCVEKNTHLAWFHNSFWEKQVSGLVFTPHNGVAAASRKSHRASIISLAHKQMRAPAHAHSHKVGSLPACKHIFKYINKCTSACVHTQLHRYSQTYFSVWH